MAEAQHQQQQQQQRRKLPISIMVGSTVGQPPPAAAPPPGLDFHHHHHHLSSSAAAAAAAIGLPTAATASPPTMAATASGAPLAKGARLSVTVVEALRDLIVVSLDYNTRVYQGALLDITNRSIKPFCTSPFPKAEDAVEDEAMFALKMRHTYVASSRENEAPFNGGPAGQGKSMETGRDKRGPRTKIDQHVRMRKLRPRQTLCTNCQSRCDDPATGSSATANRGSAKKNTAPLVSVVRGTRDSLCSALEGPPHASGGGEFSQPPVPTQTSPSPWTEETPPQADVYGSVAEDASIKEELPSSAQIPEPEQQQQQQQRYQQQQRQEQQRLQQQRQHHRQQRQQQQEKQQLLQQQQQLRQEEEEQRRQQQQQQQHSQQEQTNISLPPLLSRDPQAERVSLPSPQQPLMTLRKRRSASMMPLPTVDDRRTMRSDVKTQQQQQLLQQQPHHHSAPQQSPVIKISFNNPQGKGTVVKIPAKVALADYEESTSDDEEKEQDFTALPIASITDGTPLESGQAPPTRGRRRKRDIVVDVSQSLVEPQVHQIPVKHHKHKAGKHKRKRRKVLCSSGRGGETASVAGGDSAAESDSESVPNFPQAAVCDDESCQVNEVEGDEDGDARAATDNADGADEDNRGAVEVKAASCRHATDTNVVVVDGGGSSGSKERREAGGNDGGGSGGVKGDPEGHPDEALDVLASGERPAGSDGPLRRGDVVWGKVMGFPWWPGRILSLAKEDDPSPPAKEVNAAGLQSGEAHVAWFGSSTSSRILTSNLAPFLRDFKLRYNRRKRGPYKEAIRQASQEAKARNKAASIT